MLHTDLQVKEVAIVGLGPAGLATALALAKKGKKIIIFDKREHFSRSQSVKIDPDTIATLRALEEDLKTKLGDQYRITDEDAEFFSTFPKSQREPTKVEISAVQAFLKRKTPTRNGGKSSKTY